MCSGSRGDARRDALFASWQAGFALFGESLPSSQLRDSLGRVNAGPGPGVTLSLQYTQHLPDSVERTLLLNSRRVLSETP